MANKDAAFGFRPVRHLTGGEIRANEYTIAANYGTDIFQGQCVIAVTAGGIEAAAAGNVILGVFGGNASDIVALVYDDPRIVFEVQHDGTGTAAMNFAGFDFTGTAGSSATGRSTQELDTTTAGTSGQFKQIGISPDKGSRQFRTLPSILTY
jgi:hypothetical protein